MNKNQNPVQSENGMVHCFPKIRSDLIFSIFHPEIDSIHRKRACICLANHRFLLDEIKFLECYSGVQGAASRILEEGAESGYNRVNRLLQSHRTDLIPAEIKYCFEP